MILSSLLSVLLSVPVLPAGAQNFNVAIPNSQAVHAAPGSSGTGEVTARALLSRDVVHPGDTVDAAILLTIEDGWHINSGSGTDEEMVATSVEPASVAGVTLFDLRYPKGSEKKFAFAEKPILVYEGSVTIFARIRVADTTAPGDHPLPVVVTCQACNDDLCLAPATYRVMLSVLVRASEQPSTRIHNDVFEAAPHPK